MTSLDSRFSLDSDLRLLGLDVGDRRIGVAVSDPTGSLARPVEVYQRQDSTVDIQHVVDLAGEMGAGRKT